MRGKEQPLFLAIRKNYFNAYVEGQSVLKIGLDEQSTPNQLRAGIHQKYVHRDQAYLTFDRKQIVGKPYVGKASVDEWVKRAQTYVKNKKNTKEMSEKQGVAVIVGRNPHIIDVEMALPADKPNVSENRPSADRIDMVALEKDGEAFKIVFYEAKLFSNHAALRADNPEPKVLKQLKGYEDWMRSRTDEIIPTYRRACDRLIRLHAMRDTKTDLRAPSVHPFVLQAAKEGSGLQVDPKPRIIIFGYSAEDIGCDSSWVKNKHEEKLRSKYELLISERPEGITPVGIRRNRV